MRNDSTFRPSFLISVPLTKPRTVCACQPVSSIISASVAPWERRIRSRTSAFLLPSRATLAVSFAAGRAVSRRLLSAGDFFALPLAGATLRRLRNVRPAAFDGLPDSRHRRFPVRELLDRLQIREGSDARKAVPGIDQPGNRPVGGQLREFFLVGEGLRFVGAGGKPGRCAVMLLSESIVKVFIATPFIALFEAKAKSIISFATRI